MIGRARIVSAADAVSATPLLAPGLAPAKGRRVAREELEARLAAERIVREALSEAEAVLSRARAEAEINSVAAIRDARQEAQAELAARWLVLRQKERQRFEKNAEIVVTIAVALAERLLGAALELEPSRVAQLARTAIDEARGARRAIIDANPLDAGALRRHLTTAGLDVQSLEIRDDSALARGELLLHTDVGTIDARLAPRFERLSAAVRDALK